MATSSISTDQSDMLRRPIQANIIFSGVSVLLLLIVGSELTDRLDFEPTWFLRGVGVILTPWLGILYVVLRQEPVQPLHVLVIAIADSLWVIVSILALMLDVFSLNAKGQWAVLIVTCFVAILVTWEYVALWRTHW